MPRYTCAGCHCPVYPDDCVCHDGVVLCPECDECMTDDDFEQFQTWEWCVLNVTAYDEEF